MFSEDLICDEKGAEEYDMTERDEIIKEKKKCIHYDICWVKTKFGCSMICKYRLTLDKILELEAKKESR